MRHSLLLIALIISFAGYSKPRTSLPPPAMQGPALVFAGTAYTYSYTESFIIAPIWTIHSGTATINSTWSSGDTYYASITWTTSGRVDFFDEVEGAYVYKVVTVLAPPTAATGYTCGPDTVTLTATIGAGGTGVRWYSAATGGTLLGSLPTLKRYITSNSTYYVETWNSTYSMATSRIPVDAIKGTIPASPTSITNALRCGNGPVTLSAVPGSGGNSIQWYSSPTGGAVAHTGSSFTTPSLAASTGYYVASYDSITGCFSAGRSEVLAEIYAAPPPLTAWGDPIRYGSGQTVLNASSYTIDRHGEMLDSEIDLDVYDVFWYSTQANAENDASRLANALTYTTDVLTVSTTFYARIQDEESGCYSNIAPVIAEVVPYVTNASVRTDLVRVTGKKTEASLTTLTDAEKTTTFAYLDGVGRVQQSVVLRGSPTGKDIVMPAEYDATGRVSRQYLAYVASTTNGSFHSGYKAEQKAFYLAPSDKIADDSSAYAKTVYEESPLGRVLEQGSAGKAFQPGTTHTSRAEYSFNTTNEVRRLDKKGNSTDFYPAKTLTKVKSINAQNNHTVTFIDGAGRTILTRQQIAADVEGVYTDYLETYYVYNELGQVNFIISPKGVADLKAGSWNFTQIIKDSLSNQFRYDSKGRVIEKKVPGQAWQYIIYDPLGRVVLTQDGLLRPDNKWMFIKYDYKGNAVMTGIHTNTTYTTRATLQGQVDNMYKTGNAFGPDVWFEKQGSTLEGYTSQSFPNTNIEVLSVNYFDDYDFDNNSSADATYISAGTVFPGQHTATSLTHNRPTGGKKKILGTSTWLKTYVFYDDRGRTIQVQSTNPLNTSSMDRVTNAYADDGRTLYTRKFHNGPDTINVLNKFEYTTRGDVWKVSQAHRGNSYQLIALYEYNELGQLVDKKLHNTGGNNYLQSVDYRYTISGQLKSINNSELSSNGLNDETNDYFGMELLYDDSESGLTTTQRYDGMVSAIKWKGAGGASGTTGQKSYVLTYDKTGRLETAGYRAKESAWDKEVGAQNETMSYDHNGNIKTLTRAQRKHQLTGITASYINETIDNLTYEYASSNKNSLKKVNDAVTGDAAAIGFNNGASSTNNDYKYDANGNLLKDANKGITSIVYNFLGKPTQVNFSDNRRIEYVYDAGGNKLTQKLFQNTTLLSTTDYVNGFVYENAVLSFFGSPEGRVVKNGSILEYQYSIADHQGNTRVVFTSAAPAITAPETNFEDNSAGFMNFPSGVTLSELEFFDHTDAGSVNKKSMVLNGHNSYVGVAKTFKVYPGDKIKAEAFVKYEEEPETPLANSLAAYAEKLALAFGVSSSSTGEPLKVYNSLTSYGGAVAAGTAHNSDPDDPGAPKAFVTIIFFDKNYNYLDAAWQQVDGGYEQDDSMIEKDSFDHVVKEVVAKEEGYAYVFISNENPTFLNVYFDDVKFTRMPSNVIQYNEYYPFGLQTSSSWTREATKDNNYLYNAANELNKTSGWYEMFYRGYDPAIGRMLQVDPYATMYASSTTYNYALNNPVMINDPNGGQAMEWQPGMSSMGVERYNAIARMSESGNYFENWDQSYFARSGGYASLPFGPYQLFWAQLGRAIERNGGYDKAFVERDLVSGMWMVTGERIITTKELVSSYDKVVNGVTSKYTMIATLTKTRVLIKDMVNAYRFGKNLVPSGPFTGSNADGSTYFEGVRVYTTEVGAMGQGAAATLPGVGIFVNPTDKYNINLLRHEFGHILQARKWGNDFYNSNIIPVSLISADAANNGDWDHDSTWTEWTANLLSWRYFGRPGDWDMKNYPIYPVQHSNTLAYPPKSINLKR